MGFIFLVLVGLGVWLAIRLGAGKKKETPTPPPVPAADAAITLTVSVTHSRGTEGASGGYEAESYGGSFWEVQRPMPVEARLRIAYEDASGRASERTIDVRQFGFIGKNVILLAHCNTRNATRTFRGDRISKCWDVHSGQIVGDVGAFLMEKYNSSPEKTKDQLLDVEYDTLRVLLYVGKADGQLRKEEKAVIRKACVALTSDERLTDQMIDRLFSGIDVPSLQAFKMAVGRLTKKDQGSREIIMDAAKRMVATQKSVHANEAEALEYISKRFNGKDGGELASVRQQ